MDRILYTHREHRETKRRPSRGIRLFLFVFLFGVIAGGSIYAIRLPQWRVVNINIQGINVLTDDMVRSRIAELISGNYAFMLPRRSILLIDTKLVAKSLAEGFPRIANVSVEKKYPDTLDVVIAERALWGIFCSVECVYIDKTGFAFEDAPNTTGSLIRKVKIDGGDISIGLQVIEPTLMQTMQFLYEKVKQEIGSDVIGYELFSKIPSEIRVETSGGFTLYFNRDDNFDEVFRVLKTVLEKEIGERRGDVEYIDLRFGNKVFYKF